MCDKDTCNDASCCGECEPWNCLEQQINDALATKEEQLQGYVDEAKDAAAESKASAEASAQSAAESKEFRDEAETAASTAVAAEGVVLGVANTLQDTADKLEQIADELGTAIAGIAVSSWFYTTVSENQTVIPVPADKNAVDVQSIYIEGTRQSPFRGFEFDKTAMTITLAEPLPLGLEIEIILGTYNSDNPNDFAHTLASNNGASLVGTLTGKTVQEELTDLKNSTADLSVALDPILARLATESGLPMVGTFESGATVNTASQSVGFKAEGKLYTWAGTLPKTVAAGSTPATAGGITANAWVRVDQNSLRGQLTSDTGSQIVAYKAPLANAIKRVIENKFVEEVSVKDFGAVGDGVTDDTAAVQAAIDSGTRASEQLPSLSVPIHTVTFPKGKYAVTNLLVGRRCSLRFDGGSLQPLDPNATQPYLIKFAEGYNKVYGMCIDMKYALNYDTAVWCRGRYMDFIAPEIWAYKCAWVFGDPAWENDPVGGILGDSEIQIIGGWCNWGITHHRAYGVNTIIQMVGHEAYSYKWSLPDGDSRKTAWEALPEITGINCGALIYLTGSFTGNYSGQQPNFLSKLQVTSTADYKNTYGRYVLSGTHIETGLLFQCDAAPSGVTAGDDYTQMLNVVNCTGYVSGGRNGYFINGLDALQSISVINCNFYGNIVDRAIYALNSKVHVSKDSFPLVTNGDVFTAIQARHFFNYPVYNPFNVTTSAQAFTSTLSPLRMTALAPADMDAAFTAAYYDSTTGNFTLQQNMSNVEVEVALYPSGGASTDSTDLVLMLNGVQSGVINTVGSTPRATFKVKKLSAGTIIQVQVASYNSRTLNGSANNKISIVGSC